MNNSSYIIPNWPAIARVKAFSTTRLNGFSKAPYDSFNIGIGTEDDIENVKANRKKLMVDLQIPNEPCWLKQVHGKHVVQAEHAEKYTLADAAFTAEKNAVCVVLTADCMPVLITDMEGSKVAAVHAGWRGLAAGVIEAALKTMDLDFAKTLIWLGPAIGPEAFEVGNDVRETFINQDSSMQMAFKVHNHNKWLADIYQLARLRLEKLGIKQIYSNNYSTFRDRKLFFSHRRDQGKTGRMATLIWLE
jgi:YfiH family protein